LTKIKKVALTEKKMFTRIISEVIMIKEVIKSGDEKFYLNIIKLNL